MTVTINIPYWHTDENRLWNTGLSRRCANLLMGYLLSVGISCEVNAFDFSKEKVLEGGIHLPTEGEFSKSKKLNRAIYWLMNNGRMGEYTCFWDADCLVEESDFPRFAETLEHEDAYWCNNMQKLRSRSYVDEASCGVKPFALYYNSGVIRGLGAIWVCPTAKLVQAGPFNEKLTNWGREDEEMGERLEKIGCTFRKSPFTIWHLPHPPSKTKQHGTSSKRIA